METPTLPFVIPSRVSCHATPDIAACAPFGKERRIKFEEPTGLNRKPGGAQPRAPRAKSNGDLRFSGHVVEMFFEEGARALRPVGPVAKRQPSPEGLGHRSPTLSERRR